MDTRDELLVNTLDVIACIKERQDALRRTTRHVFTRVAMCRAKETSLNYIVASSWHFTLFHYEDARSRNSVELKALK